MQLLVRRAGFLTTVQDLGRPGHRASGVSLGGALDPHALRVANLLVDNEDSAAGIELTLGTSRFVLQDDRVIAWTGGAFDVRVADQQLPAGRAASAASGSEITCTAPPNGARAWLALSGGVDVPLVLGSRSTDLRSGFGGLEGRALRDGDSLTVGLCSGFSRLPGIATWFAPNEWSNTRSRHGFLRVVRGAEWIDELAQSTFTVTAESDRMGVRLTGPELESKATRDLLSEAVAPGTIQLPPNGQPILLLGDCQTIGGYPKIAHVITVDLSAAAQLRPGDPVRFIEVALDDAHELLLERDRELRLFRAGLALRNSWS